MSATQSVSALTVPDLEQASSCKGDTLKTSAPPVPDVEQALRTGHLSFGLGPSVTEVNLRLFLPHGPEVIAAYRDGCAARLEAAQDEARRALEATGAWAEVRRLEGLRGLLAPETAAAAAELDAAAASYVEALAPSSEGGGQRAVAALARRESCRASLQPLADRLAALDDALGRANATLGAERERLSRESRDRVRAAAAEELAVLRRSVLQALCDAVVAHEVARHLAAGR